MFFGRTDCFTNLTQQQRAEWQKEISDYPSQEKVFRFLYGWMIFPLVVADILLIPLFLLVVGKAIRNHSVSRKCYLLIANRSLDDFLSTIVHLICCIYVTSFPQVDGEQVMLFFSMCVGSFWSGMVCYVGISLFKLFAVWKPLQHKKIFTMNFCYYIIAARYSPELFKLFFSWLVYVLMFVYGVGGALVLNIPFFVLHWNCRAETCLRIVWRSRHFITVGVYFIILIVFTFTVVMVKKGRRNSLKITKSSDSVRSRSMLQRRFPLWKLGLNIATFAFCQGIYVAWCLLNIGISDECYMIRHASRMIIPFAFVVFSLTVRIFVDHLLPFITDEQLRKYLFSFLGLRKEESENHSSREDHFLSKKPLSSSVVSLDRRDTNHSRVRDKSAV